MSYYQKLKDYNLFLRNLKNNKIEYSEIWNKYRKNFTLKDQILNLKGNQRRYGVNRDLKNKKIRLFINTYILVVNFLRKINKLLLRIISRILSIIIFGKKNIVDNYRLNYPIDIQKKYFDKYPKSKYLYENIFNRLQWFYSINSFKSFAFFYRFNQFINLNDLENSNILEIGSGLCNFCMILTSQLESFSYICLDIPEMIPNGYYSIYKNCSDNNIELFLPQEIKKFFKSKCKKKILFILPSQIKSIDLRIKLFVNHESFAEMDISTVNKYLKEIKSKLDKNSFVFLVNRIARQNAHSNNLSFDTYTLFSDYNLDGLNTVVKEIDSYRDLFKGREIRENLFYIGKK